MAAVARPAIVPVGRLLLLTLKSVGGAAEAGENSQSVLCGKERPGRDRSWSQPGFPAPGFPAPGFAPRGTRLRWGPECRSQ